MCGCVRNKISIFKAFKILVNTYLSALQHVSFKKTRLLLFQRKMKHRVKDFSKLPKSFSCKFTSYKSPLCSNLQSNYSQFNLQLPLFQLYNVKTFNHLFHSRLMYLKYTKPCRIHCITTSYSCQHL